MWHNGSMAPAILIDLHFQTILGSSAASAAASGPTRRSRFGPTSSWPIRKRDRSTDTSAGTVAIILQRVLLSYVPR